MAASMAFMPKDCQCHFPASFQPGNMAATNVPGHDICAKSGGKNHPAILIHALPDDSHGLVPDPRRFRRRQPLGCIMRLVILPAAVATDLPAQAMPRYIGVELVSADPQTSNSVLDAFGWLQATVQNNAISAAAMMAVTMVGIMMLTGRMNWKLGATVILGFFILFGSAAIVTGIQTAAAMAR
jgi:type IV secretion system protein VirB2